MVKVTARFYILNETYIYLIFQSLTLNISFTNIVKNTISDNILNKFNNLQATEGFFGKL